MTEYNFIVIGILFAILITLLVIYFFIKNKYLKIITGIFLPIIISPIFYFLSIFVVISIARNYDDSVKFDSKKWKEDKSFRLKCAKDLEQSDILKNKTKNEVIKLLSEPDDDNYDEFSGETFTYELDKDTWRNGFVNILFYVDFKKDTVVNTFFVYD